MSIVYMWNTLPNSIVNSSLHTLKMKLDNLFGDTKYIIGKEVIIKKMLTSC